MRRTLTRTRCVACSVCRPRRPRLAQQIGQLLLRRVHAARRRRTLALGRAQRRRARQQPQLLRLRHQRFRAARRSAASGWSRSANYVEAGLGVGFSRRRVSTASTRDLPINDDFAKSSRSCKLRIVPFTATFRFAAARTDRERSSRTSAPASAVFAGATRRPASSSTSATSTIFRGYASSASGTAIGPVILGGIRFRSDQMRTSAAKSAIRTRKASFRRPGTSRQQDRSRRLVTYLLHVQRCGSDAYQFAADRARRRRRRTRARIPSSKAGVLARDRCARMSPPSACSSISIQPGERPRRASSAFSQMSPLPSCRKSRERGSRVARQLLHVVPERSHARHDRLAVVLRRAGTRSRCRRCGVRADPTALRRPSARRRSSGGDLDDRATTDEHGGRDRREPRAHRAATASPRQIACRGNERHHVADAIADAPRGTRATARRRRRAAQAQ